MLHEAGHAAALMLAGGRLSAILFSGLGIKMIPERNSLLTPAKEAFVLAAGPAVNLLTFAVISIGAPGNNFAVLSLAAAIFNLLPYSFLDGGSLFLLMGSVLEREREFHTAVRIIQLLLAGAALFAVIYIDRKLIMLLCVTIFGLAADLMKKNSI